MFSFREVIALITMITPRSMSKVLFKGIEFLIFDYLNNKKYFF